jgi:hypothetical protein
MKPDKRYHVGSSLTDSRRGVHQTGGPVPRSVPAPAAFGRSILSKLDSPPQPNGSGSPGSSHTNRTVYPYGPTVLCALMGSSPRLFIHA